MPISEATLQQFRTAWLEAYGIQLSIDEAKETLAGLVEYFDLLAQMDSGYDKE